MTDFLLAPGPFPVGTTVQVYPGEDIITDAGPAGAAIASAVTAADSTTTFTGLEAGTRYWAAALVGSRWQKVAFMTEAAAPAVFATATALDAAVAALQDQIDGLGGAVPAWTRITTFGAGASDNNNFFPGGSVSYYVDRGRVFMRGFVYCGAPVTTLLTIPPDARPPNPNYVQFPLLTDSNQTVASTLGKWWSCKVQSSGAFSLLAHPSFLASPNFGGAPVDAVFCLDGVSYRIT